MLHAVDDDTFSPRNANTRSVVFVDRSSRFVVVIYRLTMWLYALNIVNKHKRRMKKTFREKEREAHWVNCHFVHRWMFSWVFASVWYWQQYLKYLSIFVLTAAPIQMQFGSSYLAMKKKNFSFSRSVCILNVHKIKIRKLLIFQGNVH